MSLGSHANSNPELQPSLPGSLLFQPSMTVWLQTWELGGGLSPSDPCHMLEAAWPLGAWDAPVAWEWPKASDPDFLEGFRGAVIGRGAP